MRRTTGNYILLFSTLACFGLSAVIPNSNAKSAGRTQLEPIEFDRLDGHGPSAKKVDVIEWENNLEIHVYPKGALRSLGLKVDRTNKDKPAVVIEYGFNGVSYTLIRRAILSIPLKDGFKTYQDPSADDYDKIVLSNNTLTGGVRPFLLAPAPTQLYPDYHPALGKAAESPAAAKPAPIAPTEAQQSQQTQSDPAPKTKMPSEDGERIRNFAF